MTVDSHEIGFEVYTSVLVCVSSAATFHKLFPGQKLVKETYACLHWTYHTSV